MSAVLNMRANRVILPGPGGFTMQLSPGSRALQCQEPPSGHMILPITCFDEKDEKVDSVALQTTSACTINPPPGLPAQKTTVVEADLKPVTSTSTTVAVLTRSGRGNNVALQSSPLISSALICWIIDDPVALRQKAI
jgi:hypothetical protein